MEYFEEMALGSTPLKPSMWLRYVDDTFILWPHQEDVQISLDHVNSIRPSIPLTVWHQDSIHEWFNSPDISLPSQATNEIQHDQELFTPSLAVVVKYIKVRQVALSK